MRFLQGLNQLMSAFILSMPKLANVAAVLLLFLSLFAIMGMNLFSEVLKFPESYGFLYNEQANFDTFAKACMTFLRCMTGEAWNTLTAELGRSPFNILSELETYCVPGWGSVLVWMCFAVCGCVLPAWLGDVFRLVHGGRVGDGRVGVVGMCCADGMASRIVRCASLTRVAQLHRRCLPAVYFLVPYKGIAQTASYTGGQNHLAKNCFTYTHAKPIGNTRHVPPVRS